MQKLIILFASLAAVLAYNKEPLVPKVEVPVTQKPNNFDWDYRKPGILDLSAKGTIYDDDIHRLEGVGKFSRNFHENANAYGGGFKYTHDPSKLAAGVNVMDLGGDSRRVQAELTKTLLKDRHSNFEGGLNYGQTFTPFGNSEPFFGGFVRGTF